MNDFDGPWEPIKRDEKGTEIRFPNIDRFPWMHHIDRTRQMFQFGLHFPMERIHKVSISRENIQHIKNILILTEELTLLVI